ncbi:uncharacterized protein LOC114723126 [Neltuma alba]|uniref:uncharacterized protein LOC114723126 n=1 Tax=Neltuma alba TaxID=207710 RepID=UPI0010A2D770|nr:uncharacterized protein LOC114723126 [Prosopis alba]
MGVESENWQALFTTICWLLWRRRNERIHSNTKMEVGSIYPRASAIISCIKMTPKKLTNMQTHPNDCPGGDHTRVNTRQMVQVDGAFSFLTQTAGCGGILKDTEGKIVEGFYHRLDKGDAFTAEVWACLLGLRRAWDLGFRDLILMSDSTNALHAIETEPTDTHEDWNVIMEIKGMLQR